MRKFVMAAVLTLSVLLPAVSQAGLVVEGSFGPGRPGLQPASLGANQLHGRARGVHCVALRLQLGIVGDFADTSGSKTDLELRPMVTIVAPVLPIYGRAIFAIANLAGRGGAKREFCLWRRRGRAFRLGPDRRVR